MKSNKYLILLLLILSSNLLSSQSFRGKINSDTNEVVRFEKFIVRFDYIYLYDMDFNERVKLYSTKAKLLVEKESEFSNGRFVLVKGDNRAILKILNCFQYTYTNSSDKFYLFKCENKDGKILYYYLDKGKTGTGWRLWTKFDESQRVYFTMNKDD